ncbi:MAG: hypothetical protein JJE52_01865 [Acidimicrobiia bacterium]|nr:hypothetical protein [Acidimicrobiia bacterium]
MKYTYEIDGQVIRVRTDQSQDPLSDGGVYEAECYRWDIDAEAGYLRPQDCDEVAEARKPPLTWADAESG